MKISIIVPIYNAENTLKTCVESILLQQCKNLEVLLVDDSSSDGSPTIASELAKNDLRIKVLYSERKGVSAARNTGLEAATGDIIGFCDADDFLEPDALPLIENSFLSDPKISCVATGFYRTEDRNGTFVHTSVRVFPRNGVWSFQKLQCYSIGDQRMMGSVWNKYFLRTAIGNVRFCEELSYCEDTHFVCCVCSKNRAAYAKVLSVPIYNYVNRKGSVTVVTDDVDKLFDDYGQLKYVRAMERILSDCEFSLRLKNMVRRASIILSMDTLRHFKLGGEREKVLKKNIRDNAVFYFMNLFMGGFIHNVWRIVDYVTKELKKNN